MRGALPRAVEPGTLRGMSYDRATVSQTTAATDPKDASTASGVAPYEARTCPSLPEDVMAAAQDVVVAVNGFAYHGERLETVMATLRWLRVNPEHRQALFGDPAQPA